MMKIITHPANMKWLKQQCDAVVETGYLHALNTFEIITDENIKEYDVEYHMPKGGKFWEYEESDLAWLLPLKMAIEIRKPIFYLIRQDWLGASHPMIKSYTPYR